MAAQHVLGTKKSSKISINPELDLRSKEQKEPRAQINATADESRRRELRKERNQKLTKIHTTLNQEKYQKVLDQVAEIEKSRDDFTRMYQAIRQLNCNQPKAPLLIKGEHGLTTDEGEQIKAISTHFNDMFSDRNAEAIRAIPPTKMTIPFSAGAVAKAASNLRNNKSPGVDELKAKQLKYGPELVHKQIANILNEVAETGSNNTPIYTPKDTVNLPDTADWREDRRSHTNHTGSIST